MKYIGIDLGLSGGIVMLDENQKVIKKYVMPIIKALVLLCFKVY